MAFIEFCLFLGIIATFTYSHLTKWLWIPGLLVVFIGFIIWSDIAAWALLPFLMIYTVAVVFALFKPVRMQWLTRLLASNVKRTLPPLSETERIALEAGDVWWEGELFQGNPDWKKLFHLGKPTLSSEEQAFMENQVNTLCAMINDWEVNQKAQDLPQNVWDYIRREKFWALIIPKRYGGLEFSALAHSSIVGRIASRSLTAAVSIMVPNSLGPAELLLHYGTERQKDYYLPRLACGEEIPCFGLTGMFSGSDAASLVTDHGVVCMGQHEGQDVIGIRFSFDKRYITLAPIATLLGIAFRLYDPNHLLGEKEDVGITLCLIPRNHPGVDIGNRHIPARIPFMNGPIRGENVFIPLDWIIGGREMAGQGWRMLMECLSVGRSISLPALSNAMGQLCYRTTGAYAAIRKQFKLPIGKFEGVKDALAQIGGFTYQIEATRTMTASAVDLKVKPSLVSAITKYHLTELNRKVADLCMDVHAGRGIQMGPRNYIGFGEQAVPISITVEGANILTRNLIIFGQGAMRCHPYLRDEMEALYQKDEALGLEQFDRLLQAHISYSLSNLSRSLILALTGGFWRQFPQCKAVSREMRQLTRFSAALAFVSDISMLMLGGQLKRRESLSARLGDVLSYLYLSSTAVKYYRDHQSSPDDLPYLKWVLQYNRYQIEQAFKDFLANFPNRVVAALMRAIVFPLGSHAKLPSDKLNHAIADHMQIPSEFRERLTQVCYVGHAPDPIAVVEDAWLASIEAQPIEKKVQQAVKEGKLSARLDAKAFIQQAIENKIITEREAEALQKASDRITEALKVDEFPESYFTASSCNAPQTKTKEFL